MRARGDGLQVLIARSEEGNRELARKLTGIGVRAMTLNTLSFQEPEDWSSVDFQLRNLDSVDWIVFTSATGVKFFAKRLKELGVGLPEGGRPRVAAVGEKTAEKLGDEGIGVNSRLPEDSSQGVGPPRLPQSALQFERLLLKHPLRAS